MKIGTHNSITYLKPKKWYLYPFLFIAKCQSLPIDKLYQLGIRIFDIRISYDKQNNIEFRHGSMAYKGNVYEILKWLNDLKEPISIRILLEEKKESLIKETLFIKDLNRFQNEFKNLTFYEGRRKFDWKLIVDLPTLEVVLLVSSMQGNKLDDLWPWFYAKLNNKKNIKLYSDDKPLLLDFINESLINNNK